MKGFIFTQPDLECLYELRHKVLRPGKPPETAIFEGDESALHYAFVSKNKAMAALSFYQKSWEGVPFVVQYQLRGMAVLPELQVSGLGAKLLQLASEELLKKHQELMIWCNARLHAVPFYKKQGFETFGNSFEISEIGTHYKMYKIWGR